MSLFRHLFVRELRDWRRYWLLVLGGFLIAELVQYFYWIFYFSIPGPLRFSGMATMLKPLSIYLVWLGRFSVLKDRRLGRVEEYLLTPIPWSTVCAAKVAAVILIGSTLNLSSSVLSGVFLGSLASADDGLLMVLWEVFLSWMPVPYFVTGGLFVLCTYRRPMPEIVAVLLCVFLLAIPPYVCMVFVVIFPWSLFAGRGFDFLTVVAPCAALTFYFIHRSRNRFSSLYKWFARDPTEPVETPAVERLLKMDAKWLAARWMMLLAAMLLLLSPAILDLLLGSDANRTRPRFAGQVILFAVPIAAASFLSWLLVRKDFLPQNESQRPWLGTLSSPLLFLAKITVVGILTWAFAKIHFFVCELRYPDLGNSRGLVVVALAAACLSYASMILFRPMARTNLGLLIPPVLTLALGGIIWAAVVTSFFSDDDWLLSGGIPAVTLAAIWINFTRFRRIYEPSEGL